MRGAVDAQPHGDVLANAGVGGGGEREHAGVAELLPQLPEEQVVGAEVVPPLRDAVRLVDGEQVDAVPPQSLDQLRVAQALGRDVQQRQLAAHEGQIAGVLLGPADRRIDECRLDVGAAQVRDLVAHQGDQRRDDQRAPDLERRQDEAGALAAARRHDADDVTVRQRFEHLGLAVAQVRVAKRVPQARAVGIKAGRELDRSRWHVWVHPLRRVPAHGGWGHSPHADLLGQRIAAQPALEVVEEDQARALRVALPHP